MSEINEKLLNLRSTIFKNENTLKAHTLRLPIDLTAQLDALAEYSSKSKNTIATEILDLGMAYFISSLDAHERSDIAELYERHKQQIMIDAMTEGK